MGQNDGNDMQYACTGANECLHLQAASKNATASIGLSERWKNIVHNVFYTTVGQNCTDTAPNYVCTSIGGSTVTSTEGQVYSALRRGR